MIAEFTGGPLDGTVRRMRTRARVAFTQAQGVASWYASDDDTGTFVYTGSNQEGQAMAGIVQRFTEAARRQREAEQALAERARRARGCLVCGMTFGSEAAYTVAHDPYWPGGCLPPGAAGQLVQLDGIWVIPGSDAARRLSIGDAESVKKVVAQA